MGHRAGMIGPHPLPLGTAPRVRFQVFPIAADRAALQDFCDRWLNQKLPPEVAVFRPAFPLVFCSVLTYDEMFEVDRWRSGIYAQNEVYFLVLVDRLRFRAGGLEHVERGVVTPFIFVDDAESASIGRERFGFPKELCRFDDGWDDEGRVPWAADASAYLNVRIWRPGRGGRRLVPLMTVVKNLRLLDPGFDDTAPRRTMPRPLGAYRTDFLWWAQTLGREYAGRGRKLFEDLGDGLARLAELFTDELGVSVFNLRQIPDVRDVMSLRYRDLVRYRLRLRRLQNFRLFAEHAGGDAPFTLFIARQGRLPVVDVLGLRVDARERRPSRDGTKTFDVCYALAPAYLQGDVVFERAERLTWQLEEPVWHVPGGRLRRPGGRSGRAALDTSLGSTWSLVVDRPRADPPEQDLKVLVLPAHAHAVRKVVQELLPRPGLFGIEPVTLGELSPVRLVFASSRQVRRPWRRLVWTDGKSLSISLLVTFELGGERRLARLVVEEFIDNPLALLLNKELYGGPSRAATFDEEAVEDWFSSSQPVRHHVSLGTPVIDRRPDEARVESRPWLQVVSRPGPPSLPPALDELGAAFLDQAADVEHLLVVGGIPDPADPNFMVERRITYVQFDFSSSVPVTGSLGDRQMWAQFRITESLDLVGRLGLSQDSDPSLTSLWPGRDDPSAIGSVPVVGFSELARRSTATRIEPIWQKEGRSRVPTAIRPRSGRQS